MIGITSYAQPAHWGAWELPAALVPLHYVDSVEQAGGRALVVPPSQHAVEETLDVLDGIVFSGGIDIDPRPTVPTAIPPPTRHRHTATPANCGCSRPRSSATSPRSRSAAASSC